MPDHDPESLGEYTRLRANIQLGDGPDQRGDATVEVVREPESGIEVEAREVTIPTGDDEEMVTVRAPASDVTFAEFYRELTRAERALSEALGLADDGD